MGRKYSIKGSGTTGTDKTLVTLVSATTIRPKIFDLVVGYSATPADNAATFVAQRFTAAGTAAGAITPRPLDPGEPASLASSGTGDFSVEPTYTASVILLEWARNQSAPFRWVAAPGGELVCPATAANGIGIKTTAGPAVVGNACIHFEE